MPIARAVLGRPPRPGPLALVIRHDRGAEPARRPPSRSPGEDPPRDPDPPAQATDVGESPEDFLRWARAGGPVASGTDEVLSPGGVDGRLPGGRGVVRNGSRRRREPQEPPMPRAVPDPTP